MVNGQVVFVVIKRTPRLSSVVEGLYLATSESGSGDVAWVDDSGLVSFAKREDVFTDEEAANKRSLVSEGRT